MSCLQPTTLIFFQGIVISNAAQTCPVVNVSQVVTYSLNNCYLNFNDLGKDRSLKCDPFGDAPAVASLPTTGVKISAAVL